MRFSVYTVIENIYFLIERFAAFTKDTNDRSGD